ncbi:MAG: hypothetical protein QOH83_3014 [Solirubrobacteraceae bacterium]|nr:hypothetical protein [Solirubrobacteraceae bacterium]
MADRQDSDREVLTSLPRSRPVRRSAKRGDRPDPQNGAKANPQRAAAAPRGAKATTAGAAKTTAARAAKTTAGGAKAGAGGAKPPTARAARPKPRAGRTTAERRRGAPPRKVPPAGYAAPTSRPQDPAGSGAAELISTTIQAAGELAQIGMTVARQTLQSMVDRLPKP